MDGMGQIFCCFLALFYFIFGLLFLFEIILFVSLDMDIIYLDCKIIFGIVFY